MNNLDLGVIGNCRTAALISKNGGIEWLCFPDFDSASLFSGLLDAEKGGRFGFTLSEGYVSRQEYLKDTNILRTVFTSGYDVFEVLDFMPRYAVAPSEYYMPPEVYRLIRPISGSPRFAVDYQPVMNYAREQVYHEIHTEFVLTASETYPKDNIHLYSSLNLDGIVNGEEFLLNKDEFMLLAYHQKLVPIDLSRVTLELERTKVYWLNWSSRSLKFERYSDLAMRSLLVLKLMTFEHTGAILAALTTSIPEAPGEGRNWDYRFCWLRDASMSIVTLLRMGHQNAARRFLRFIKRVLRSKGDTIQIMYGIRGERILTEETLDHLSGFENSRPVRIGNAAYSQKQNDSFGYLMDLIYNYYLYFAGTLDDLEEMWEIVKKVGGIVATEWNNPDAGIWEFRHKNDHYVFSKLMCWVAMDRAGKIANILGRHEEERIFQDVGESIKEDILSKGWNSELQSFTQTYGGEDMDSSLLLMEQYGFIKADDDRYVQTVDRIQRELLHNGLMYRYKNADDFGQPHSAFTICTFWLVRALYVTGREDEAEKIFNDAISCCNHVGLLSEDLDFTTKRQLGNFPQAYSHLALIDVVMLISKKKFWSPFIRP